MMGCIRRLDEGGKTPKSLDERCWGAMEQKTGVRPYSTEATMCAPRPEAGMRGTLHGRSRQAVSRGSVASLLSGQVCHRFASGQHTSDDP